MMVANSSNLIITVKPINQRNNISAAAQGSIRGSGTSFTQSRFSLSQGDDEEDEVVDLLKSASQLHLSTQTLSGGTLDGRSSNARHQFNSNNPKSSDHLFMNSSSATLDRKAQHAKGSGGGQVSAHRTQSSFTSQPNLYQ